MTSEADSRPHQAGRNGSPKIGATPTTNGPAKRTPAGNGTTNVPANGAARGRRAGGPPPSQLIHDDPLAALVDEAQAAVSEGANALRDIRERYREAYLDRVEDWERLRTQTAATRTSSQADSDEAMIGREVNL